MCAAPARTCDRSLLCCRLGVTLSEAVAYVVVVLCPLENRWRVGVAGRPYYALPVGGGFKFGR